MAQHNVTEILTANGEKCMVEVANRDSEGNKISTTYAKTDYVQANSGSASQDLATIKIGNTAYFIPNNFKPGSTSTINWED